MTKWCCTLFVALILTAGTAFAAATETVKPGEFIPTTPPQPAPEISFTTLDGKAVTLADFHGKPIILNLWATWCQPCLKEMPSLAKVPGTLGDGVVLLAVSQDRGGAKVVEPFVAKLGLGTLKYYLDPKSTVGHAFEVRGLPTTIVIDGKGQVLGRVEGAADWDSGKLLGILKKLIGPDAKPGEPELKRAG